MATCSADACRSGRGTGLGLAIVQDVVTDIRGSVEAVAHGDIGGAKFVITLPIKVQ